MILLAMLMVSWAWFWLGPLILLPVCVNDQTSAHSFCQLDQCMPVFITLWSYISHARVSIVRLVSRHRAGLLFRALFAGILSKQRKRKPFAGCFGSIKSYLATLWRFYEVHLDILSCMSTIQVDIVDRLCKNPSAASQWKGTTTKLYCWPCLVAGGSLPSTEIKLTQE